MNNRKFWGFGVLALVVMLAINIQVPYYINKPGSAIPLAPMVEVEGGYEDEKGSLRMTTVRSGPTNVAGYLLALVDPNTDLIESELIHSPHETDDQYLKRQIEIMKASQDTAKIVAFQKSGYDVQLTNSGAIIMQLIPGYPAEKVLQIGDVIIKVNEMEVETAADLFDALKDRAAHETVHITYLRDGKEQTADLTLKPLPVKNEEGEQKPGIGIASPITKREFQLPKEVNITSENIGGPSAGLMFTLEMINQLTEGDLTQGYDIAGTGTIDEEGKVGRIGGIGHKVVASEREEVDIFFAPAVKDDDGNSNYEEAMKKAKEAHMDMEIVPIDTIDDALRYLEQLTPKN